MTDFSYVREHYDVPACYGRRVTVSGKPGTIIQDKGHYIGVNFDADKPGVVKPCHPTSEVEYHDIGNPRKLTRSQRRYLDYLDCGECFDDFHSYLKYLSDKGDAA
ncbi:MULTISPECIES: hypothetical protein [unclassified Thalassospira]|uniref:hypothetical protein n=1 Tax=unclassified Thalassospira TaxID=2648997 RepID=UPI0007A60267|nr:MULTISPECIES: hypothetical protein [unclassified Thalassospira]KZC99729.1 hypothetical protein AUQ41_08615 [Thalassospira sp. MCCC 1A02898]ONH85341.1 hypothetical protein TH47_05720 [Thalassospira sp. MCCC 1A02803]